MTSQTQTETPADLFYPIRITQTQIKYVTLYFTQGQRYFTHSLRHLSGIEVPHGPDLLSTNASRPCMLLSSCEGVSAAADTLTRIPISSGVGTCSGSVFSLGSHVYWVEAASAAPSEVGAIDLGTCIMPACVISHRGFHRAFALLIHRASHVVLSSNRILHSAAHGSYSGASTQTFSACATRSACAARVAGTPVAVTLNSAPAPRPLRGEGRTAAAAGGSIGERGRGV